MFFKCKKYIVKCENGFPNAYATYPAVLLRLPLWCVLVDLSACCAVGELEKAGKHAVDLCGVGENWVLEVHSMRDNVVVLIHPEDTQTQNL